MFGTPACRGIARRLVAPLHAVLVERCYECHSAQADEPGGGLRLDSREGIRRGGESGPAVVPGDVKGGRLLSALRYQDFEMPPDGRLDERLVADFERWIAAGAVDPRDGEAGPVRPAIDFATARRFWAFQPPRGSPLPKVESRGWPRGRIDGFVLARLESEGLIPAPRADRRTLIRRLSYDLTGLPPSDAEVRAFVADERPGAYERLVDRLLASPRHGEPQARMWLDVARYAEDQAHIVGNNRSLFYPNAYHYRDWVIRAWNADLPYDEFVRLQLAADLVAPGKRQHQPALGFLGLGPKYYRRNSLEVMADEWEDRVDTVSRGLLGLTVACARCHDHKYDPLATDDYYALAGVFASTRMFNRPLDEGTETSPDGEAKDPAQALHVVREGEPTDLHVMIRGDVNRPGSLVPRRFLEVLSPDSPRPFGEGSGRRELAAAIVDRSNPLTARVIVNRVWGRFFGRPLAATPSNFGRLGEPPTHPLLLDDLAVRFMDAGWSLKWLQREIVLSSTYRQASEGSAESVEKDPANLLLARMNRRRLQIEAWRDTLLAVSGRLDPTVGGPSIDPQEPESRRRTVYARVSRLDLNPMLATFDFPDPNAHSAGRAATTTPLQKLFVMNSPFVVRQADALAARILAGPSADDPAAGVLQTYRLLLQRDPTPRERELGVGFLRSESDREAAWRKYAQVMLASNELLFID